jgi:hypothetical protein
MAALAITSSAVCHFGYPKRGIKSLPSQYSTPFSSIFLICSNPLLMELIIKSSDIIKNIFLKLLIFCIGLLKTQSFLNLIFLKFG